MLSDANLNPEQYRAVTYRGDAHCLILAGAGSGKTRVLTHRIAWLIAQGVPAYAILAITFTNKAAQEMRDRALALIGGDRASGLRLSTFHAFGALFIRRYADYIGLTPSYSVYGDSEQKSLVKSIMESLGLLHSSAEILDSDQKHNKTAVNEALSAIASFKEKGILPDEAKRMARSGEEKNIAVVYEAYERKLIDNNAVDFAGLLLWPLRMLQTCEDLRIKTQNRYSHILVDEFQDTNAVQLDLLSAIMGKHTRLTAVGDDDQSIYAWRGADPTAILDFSARFGACEVFKLEQNYRSTKPILRCAAQLIACNQNRASKTLWTDRDGGVPVAIASYESDRDEAADIMRKIAALRQTKHNDWSDYAVLFRKNTMSLGFEQACAERGIPYQIVGSFGFFEREEIADLMAYLRVLANPLDSVAFLRIINKPARSIGEKTAAKILALIEQKTQFGISPREAMFKLFGEIADGKCKIARAGQKVIDGCAQLYDLFAALSDWNTMPLRAILETIIEKTHFIGHLKKQMAKKDADFGDAIERIGNLKTTLDSFKPDNPDAGNGLADFLSSMSLVRPESDNACNTVKLMTIHGAKGLEFDTVFIAGAEEGILPLERGGVCDVEEERRLMYVAITRAKRELSVSFAAIRYEFGRMQIQKPSRFIEEMEGCGDNSGFIEKTHIPFGDPDAVRRARRAGNCGTNRPKLAWSHQKQSQNRRFSDDDFADEVGGGIARPFGRKKESRFAHEQDDFAGSMIDAPFYEEQSVPLHDPGVGAPTPQTAQTGFAANHCAKTDAVGKNNRPVSVGCNVRHSVHGEGRVLRIDKAADDFKVLVEFPKSGKRTILARFLIVL